MPTTETKRPTISELVTLLREASYDAVEHADYCKAKHPDRSEAALERARKFADAADALMGEPEDQALATMPIRLLRQRLAERKASGKKTHTVEIKFAVHTAQMIVDASEAL